MKVWISYLLDQMEAFRPQCFFDISETRPLKISAVCSYHPSTKAFRSGTLYLCLDAAPDPGTSIPDDAFFVLSPNTDRDILPNKIVLHTPPAQERLLNLLLNCVERYQAWLEKLIGLALEKGDAKAFCDVGEEMLINPILVQDSSYALIAISSNASADDYPFFDFGGTLRPFPEFLFRMQREIKVLREYVLRNDEGTFIIGSLDDQLQVLYKIYLNGVACAHVVFPLSKTRLSQGILDLLHDFCHYLRYSHNISPSKFSVNSTVNYAVEQILVFGSTTAMENLLHPKPHWYFLSGTLQGTTSKEKASNYLFQVQDILPHSVAYLYQDQIFVLLCVSDQDTEAVYAPYQYQRLENIAIALDSVFGLSYMMPSLSGIGHGIRQCKKALELTSFSQKTSPSQPNSRLYFYEWVATTDILSDFFSDKAFESYFPPEILSLYYSDLRREQNNCEVLYHYLLTGKSLADTSKALHMHRSTVVYRLERIKEVYHLDLNSPQRNQIYLLCCQHCTHKSNRADPFPASPPILP